MAVDTTANLPLSPTPKGKHPLLHALSRLVPGNSTPSLDTTLDNLNTNLGLGEGPTADPTTAFGPIDVHDTADKPRSIYYAPTMDGQPEPGEVVRIWAPSDGEDKPYRDRAVLVVGHNRHSILGLLISPNPEHQHDEHWLEIGTGEWDQSGRQCWVRLDRILEVSFSDIRRQGVLFPRQRFSRIATKLRNHFGWT